MTPLAATDESNRASRVQLSFLLKFSEKDKNWKLEFDFGNDAEETGELVDFSGQEELGICPKSGGRVYELGRNYVCEHVCTEAQPEATCDFKSRKIILQQPVEREQMTKLLTTGKTDLLEKFVSMRTRRPFKAFLAWDKEAGKANFEFTPSKFPRKERPQRPAFGRPAAVADGKEGAKRGSKRSAAKSTTPKGFLRKLYQEWYDRIVEAMPSGQGGILEIGSGGGFLDERLPELITSEVQVCPHVRLVLDAQTLPLGDATLRAIVMIDVLHHLPESRRFLREAARCVRPGGRLVMIEPWVSPWSSVIYRALHHEPFRPDAAEWEFPPGGPLSAANMALPWIIFVRDRPRFERECPQWRVVSLTPFMPFRYLMSGGVSMRSLMPAWTFGLWRAVENALTPWSRHLGMFAHIVIERTVVPSRWSVGE